MATSEQVDRLGELIEQMEDLHDESAKSKVFRQWRRDVLKLLTEILGEHSYIVQAFADISFAGEPYDLKLETEWGTEIVLFPQYDGYFHDGITLAEAILNQLFYRLQNEDSSMYVTEVQSPVIQGSHFEKVLFLCEQFSAIALELRNVSLHGRTTDDETSRPRLLIKDEYDLQYLFSGLLKLFFIEHNIEVDTEQDFGRSARIDLVINEAKIAIELKYVSRSNQREAFRKQITDDLSIYPDHSDCEQILFFIYDPDHKIRNAREFEADANKLPSHLPYQVLIRPIVQ